MSVVFQYWENFFIHIVMKGFVHLIIIIIITHYLNATETANDGFFYKTNLSTLWVNYYIQLKNV